MMLRTVVVEGPLALASRRLAAARAGTVGLQVATLPGLAERLAGGFLRSCTRAEVEQGIGRTLEEGDLGGLECLRTMPGAVRAVSRTLLRLWQAAPLPGAPALASGRLADLASIDRRVRATLPHGSLAPPDLAAAALARVHLAPKVLGPIDFERLSRFPPTWRPLVEALRGLVPVRWLGPAPADWLQPPGEHVPGSDPALPRPERVACADPRAEIIETLRWVRFMLSQGHAPSEIAVAAADPGPWDETLLGLRTGTGLPVHFTHGIPVICTRDGQACAALADLLSGGLSRDRVQRLLLHSAGRAPGLAGLPSRPLAGISPDAALTSMDRWRTALDGAEAARGDGPDSRPVLLGALALANRGLAAAAEAGKALLDRAAGRIWEEALRGASPHALPFSLGAVRVADDRECSDSVTWGPAAHLAASPRPYVRLLGLAARSWPRARTDDPLLPAHLLPEALRSAPTLPELDRRAFAAIRGGATGALVLSRGRRTLRGSPAVPSPMLPAEVPEWEPRSQRLPGHAFSAEDRLFARPVEAAANPGVAAAAACAAARRSGGANAHDGLVRAGHPAIAAALAGVQSSGSLRLLVRDPLGFVWRHALGWRSPTPDLEPLELDARSFGDLVHELLRRAVDALEPTPGLTGASPEEIADAVRLASTQVQASWPPLRLTPPPLLWLHTVGAAAALALRALNFDPRFRPGTRSFTEVPFGIQCASSPGRELPWDPCLPVPVPGSAFRIEGRIDRVDLRWDGEAVQVTDYKTGRPPSRGPVPVIQGGRELQRVLYALAARTLVPEIRQVRARLVFLGTDPPVAVPLSDADGVAAALGMQLASAAASLLAGNVLPGPDAEEEWSGSRLALPAPAEGYHALKRSAFLRACDALADIWRAK